jgi:hypothetical protein
MSSIYVFKDVSYAAVWTVKGEHRPFFRAKNICIAAEVGTYHDIDGWMDGLTTCHVLHACMKDIIYHLLVPLLEVRNSSTVASACFDSYLEWFVRAG